MTIPVSENYVDELRIEGIDHEIVDTNARTTIEGLETTFNEFETTVEETMVNLNGNNTYGHDSVSSFPGPNNIIVDSKTLFEYLRSVLRLVVTTHSISFNSISAKEWVPIDDYLIDTPDNKVANLSDYKPIGIVGHYQWNYHIRLTSHYLSGPLTPSKKYAISCGLENTSSNSVSGGAIKFKILWASKAFVGLLAGTGQEASSSSSTIDCPNCDGNGVQSDGTPCPYWLSSENRHMTTREIQEFEWLEWHYQDPETGLWYESRTGNTDPVDYPFD